MVQIDTCPGRMNPTVRVRVRYGLDEANAFSSPQYALSQLVPVAPIEGIRPGLLRSAVRQRRARFSRRLRLGHPLEGSSPAEIVGQVAGGDAVEATHPALQPAVVGVHVLHVEGAVAHPNAGRDVDRLVRSPCTRRRRRRPCAIGAEHGITGDHGASAAPIASAPRSAARHRRCGRRGRARSGRDLLGREPPLARPLATRGGAARAIPRAAPSREPLWERRKKVSSAHHAAQRLDASRSALAGPGAASRSSSPGHRRTLPPSSGSRPPRAPHRSQPDSFLRKLT